MALTVRQQNFVNEYLVDLNATQAAIRAGYSTSSNISSAAAAASRLLRNVNVSVAISAAMVARGDRTKITADRVLTEIGRIALCDPRKAYDENSVLLPPKQWPDEIAAAISRIKVLVIKDADGNEVGQTQEISFWPKNDSLALAARHFGLLNDKMELTVSVGDQLRAGLDRMRKPAA